MTNKPNKLVDGVLMPFSDADMEQLATDIAASGNKALVVPENISARQFMQQLATDGDITWDECFAYLGQGVIPSIFAAAIAKIPIDDDPNAQNKVKAAFIGANSFDRHNPTTEALGQLIGKSDADLDDIWVQGALLL